MSASLVGSEMCIRDSLSHVSQGSSPWSSSGCHRSESESLTGSAPASSDCLLYTSDAADDM
eukprot:14628555-Alexandrium_andersonii.AAC.1